MIRKEYEAKQEAIQKKQVEEKQRIEEELKKRQQMQKEIDDYIDNGAKTPQVLRIVAETQPGKEVCQFYTKTGACRYRIEQYIYYQILYVYIITYILHIWYI